MENNKENQECTAAQAAVPEKKKKGFFKKFIVPGLAIVGGVAVVYLIDDKFCGGKGRKFVAKQASNVVGRVTKPKTPQVEHRHEEPAVRITEFVAAVETPERHQDARPFVKKSWDNGNRAADNKHINVQRNN